MHAETKYTVRVVRENAEPELVDRWLVFRHEFFVERLGWRVKSVRGRERDEFDHQHARHCIVEQYGRVVAGFRTIRTDYPYLARDVFSQLAKGRQLPQDANHWEISRFGVLPNLLEPDRSKFLYGLMFQLAYSMNATSLVALVDLAHERNLTRLGIVTERYGPPQLIGVDRRDREIVGVVGEIPLHGQTDNRFHSMLKMASALEASHDTHVL